MGDFQQTIQDEMAEIARDIANKALDSYNDGKIPKHEMQNCLVCAQTINMLCHLIDNETIKPAHFVQMVWKFQEFGNQNKTKVSDKDIEAIVEEISTIMSEEYKRLKK